MKISVPFILTLILLIPAFSHATQPVAPGHCKVASNVVCKDKDFSGGDYSGVNIVDSEFINVDFSGANLERATFSGEFAESKFISANLKKASFTYFYGDDTDFSMADLSGSFFFVTNMTKAKFRNANLGDSEITGDFWLCDFKGANFENTKLDGTWNESDFTGARFNGATINAKMRYADFTGADFTGATFGVDAMLENSVFDEAIWTDGRICAPGSIGTCN